MDVEAASPVGETPVEGNEDESFENVQIPELNKDVEGASRSRFKKMDKFRAKVRKLVRVMGSFLPSNKSQNEGVEVRVDVVDSQHEMVNFLHHFMYLHALTSNHRMGLQIQTQESPTQLESGVAQETPAPNQPQRRQKVLRSPSLSYFSFVQSPRTVAHPFVVPVIQVSSPDPPGLSKPIPSSLEIVPTEPSPALTLEVEPTTRADAKLDENTESGGNESTELDRVKNRSESRVVDDRKRERSATFSFGGMTGLAGGKTPYW